MNVNISFGYNKTNENQVDPRKPLLESLIRGLNKLEKNMQMIRIPFGFEIVTFKPTVAEIKSENYLCP